MPLSPTSSPQKKRLRTSFLASLHQDREARRAAAATALQEAQDAALAASLAASDPSSPGKALQEAQDAALAASLAAFNPTSPGKALQEAQDAALAASLAAAGPSPSTASSSFTSSAEQELAHCQLAEVLALLRLALESEKRAAFSSCLIAGPLSFVGKSGRWACGWRNIQMLVSTLLSKGKHAGAFGPALPNILGLQRMLEEAWRRGWDPRGATEFGGRVCGTRRWIGAGEAAALLRSRGVACGIVEFLEPSSATGRHDALLAFCLTYFTRGIDGALDAIRQDRAVVVNVAPLCRCGGDSAGGYNAGQFDHHACSVSRPPLYLQWEGHSVTVVGVQCHHRALALLVLDPAKHPDVLREALRRGGGAWSRLFKRGQHTFSKRSYQILYLGGGDKGKLFKNLPALRANSRLRLTWEQQGSSSTRASAK